MPLPTLPQTWDYNTRFINDCVIPFNSKSITIKQSPKDLDTLQKLNSLLKAIVACKYLELHFKRDQLAGKRVIELGSGVGLLGIAIALLGAKLVVLTDQPNMMEILRKNVVLNVKTRNAKVKQLNWGTDISKFSPPYDMIIASDVIYEDHCIDILVQTISDLSDSNSTIIIAHERRGMSAEEKFYTTVNENFDVHKEDGSLLDPVFNATQITLCFLRKKIKEDAVSE